MPDAKGPEETVALVPAGQHCFQSRPMALGYQGAVSTPHLLASQAAVQALQQGGNAIDAAVVAAAICTVVQPFSSSLAGVGWASVFRAASGRGEVLRFSGPVPRALRPDPFRTGPLGLVDWEHLEKTGSPLLGSLTPNVVAGWQELLSRHGTWPLVRALAPAISHARHGVPVSELLSAHMAANARRLARWPASQQVFLAQGRPLSTGELLVQPDLARTLERVGQNGHAEMVDGETGRAIVSFNTAHGGALSRQDLEEAQPVWSPPLLSRFRDWTVHAAPGAVGDVAFAAGLQLLDSYDPFDGPEDPRYVHISIEAAKLVAAERAQLLGPLTDEGTVSGLLSKAHTGELRSLISERAQPGRTWGQVKEDTITLAVVDAEGNAVNLMQTVGTLFGTGAMAPGTGALLNSSLYFTYTGAATANRIVPGLPVEQNPCLAMLFDEQGNLRLVAGSPGGKTRTESVRQLIVNVVDYGMNVQQAVDAGRFLSSPDGASIDFETRYGPVAPALRQALEARGHVVRVKDEAFGSGHVIGVRPITGVRMAGADWRRESIALAY